MEKPEDPRVSLELLRRMNEVQGAELATLKGGGGGGTSDDMEQRVQKLETAVGEITKTLASIDKTVAVIEERTKHFPTRWDVFLILAAVLAVIGVSVTLARALWPV